MKDFDRIILIGVAAGLGYALSRTPDVSFIGKIYDTYPIKPGNLVDKAWARQSITDRKYMGASRPEVINFIEPLKVVKQFNLHSIEFGNWMNQEDRVNYLVAAGVSMADMARVFSVSQNKIGFNKHLSLALGARGKGGGAAGFFSPSVMVINLTKPHGHTEVFGHEYGHAIDWTLGDEKKFVSGGRSMRKEIDHKALNQRKDSIPYLMEMVFKILYYDDNGNNTGFHNNLKDETDYYQRREEVWARTIEVFIAMRMGELGITNKFLAAKRNGRGRPPQNLVEKAEPYIRKLIKKAL